MYACARAYVRACVRVCMCVCVCARVNEVVRSYTAGAGIYLETRSRIGAGLHEEHCNIKFLLGQGRFQWCDIILMKGVNVR